jgi:hypothetical protein
MVSLLGHVWPGRDGAMSETKKFTWSAQQVAILAFFVKIAMGEILDSLVVRARAGCGKTTTIVEGIRQYVAAWVARFGKGNCRILATSFARKITKALEAKLADLPQVEVKGLNSLGNGCIMRKAGRRNIVSTRKWDLAQAVICNGMQPNTVADKEAVSVVGELNYKARELAPLAESPRDILWVAESFGIEPTEAMVSDGWTIQGVCEAAFDCMMLAAKQYHEIDFADQLFLPLRNGWTTPIYDLIVVDETQDLTLAQLLLAERMGKKDAKFIIVGDDQQAIFGFRGADVTALDRLKDKLHAKELGLTITRRCPKSHVAIASKLVPDFTCADDAPEGTVTDTKGVEDLVEGIQPGHMVISRTNAPLVPTCLKLLRAGKRAYVAGRDFGAALAGIVRKLKLKTLADLSAKLDSWYENEIKRVSGKKQAKDEKWLADQIETAGDKVATILAMAEGLTTSDELITRINTLCIEPEDSKQDAILLGTTHKVKGLEAHTTWVLEGTFSRPSPDQHMVLYVALTRSFDTMHLVQGFEKQIERD